MGANKKRKDLFSIGGGANGKNSKETSLGFTIKMGTRGSLLLPHLPTGFHNPL